MKVDYLSVHFKTSIIPSRTKHESFDSFGSHAQLFRVNSHSFFMNVMSLSSSYHSPENEKKKNESNPKPKYLEDSSDKIKNM
jgi:hypothetical protein